jgi:hypothetical protein
MNYQDLFDSEDSRKFRKMPPASAKQRAKASETHKGKIISDEHRAKISAAHKDKVVSEEVRQKLRQASLGNIPGTAVRIMTPRGEFPSLAAAAKAYGRFVGTIAAWCKSKPAEFYRIKEAAE